MTAEEQQGQRVVGGRWRLVFRALDAGFGRAVGGDGGLAPPPGGLAAPLVGEPPHRDGDQPALGVRRDALLRPLHAGVEQGLLDRVLTAAEVAVAADEGTENL